MFKWAFQRSQQTLAKKKEQAQETPKKQPISAFQSQGNTQSLTSPLPSLDLSACFQSIEQFILKETYTEGRFQDSVSPKAAAIHHGFEGNATINEDHIKWGMSHGIIGWQACALLTQNWLIYNACSIPPEDAVRHGWHLTQGQNGKIEDQELEAIAQADKAYNVKAKLTQFGIKTNVFGFCLALFKVYSYDPEYYQKPFNIDAVMPDSYEGIAIIEPFWISPGVTSEEYSDPSSLEFYEPEFWNIQGKLYHKSHFVIIRDNEVPNILKPTYYFGGIPLVQRIYQRVYAAERTANEAPLLAHSKRLMVYKTNMSEAILHPQKLEARARFQRDYADNFSIQFADRDEDVQKLETSLGDVDDLITTQYDLVAAVAGIPVTKLMCTSMKGLNSTGEGEMLNYHEKLESIQSKWFDPFLDKHYQLLLKSMDLGFNVHVTWEPTDSVTAEKQAAINAQNAQTISLLIQAGVISPLEGRMALQDNKKSGFTRFEAIEPVSTPGMNPENVIKLTQTQGKTLEDQSQAMLNLTQAQHDPQSS